LEIARQIHRVASGNPLTSLAQSVSQLAPLSKPQFDNIAVATTIYANIISGGIGRVMTGQFFGYPYWQQKLVDTDVNPAIQIASAGFNNFSYTLNYVGILMGAGGATAPDVNLYRSAANVLKTDDTLDAAGLKVASLTGVLRADSGVVSAPTSQQLLNTGRATFNTTAAETSLLASAFNLAAGTLVNNGDRLNIKLSYWQKNNTGSAVTFLHKLKVGGNSATVVNSYSQSTSAFVPQCRVECTVIRTSATTVTAEYHVMLGNALGTSTNINHMASQQWTVSDLASNTLNFDYTIQMGTSDVNAEIAPKLVDIRLDRV
jgi:hypothetical protein